MTPFQMPAGASSPHTLIGIPKALYKSELWRKLPGGARDYYLYLLSRSNTRTFKDVWPGVQTICTDLGIDRRTMRRYEKILSAAGILKVIAPGKRDSQGNFHISRRFRFTLFKYRNADYREYNEKYGREVFPIVKDMATLEEKLDAMARKHEIDLSRIERKVELIESVLDEVAQRLKITSIDERGRVHVTLYSKKYTSEFVQAALPDNILVFQDPKNTDVIVDQKQNWNLFERRLSRELEQAKKQKSFQPLIDVLEQFNTSKGA